MRDFTEPQETTKQSRWKLFFPLLAVAALLPWLFVQMGVSVNTNHAWLTIAARRIIDGGHMTTDVYETNPPLSILLYFPDVFMTRYLGVPAEYAPYIFGLVGLALSSLALSHILRSMPGMDASRRAASAGVRKRAVCHGSRSPSAVWR